MSEPIEANALDAKLFRARSVLLTCDGKGVSEKTIVLNAVVRDFTSGLSNARAALNESSCYWQAVAMHYGKDHAMTEAEKKSLDVRDAAILAINNLIGPK